VNVKIQNRFIFSAAVILFVTAVAKIFSATGPAQALSYPDPVLPLTNRHVFYLVGGIELVVSAFLLIKNGCEKIKLCLVAWLAVNFLIYRLGLQAQGSLIACDCLGNFNDKLPLSPRATGWFMFATSIWLFLGSVGFLTHSYLRRNKPVVIKKPLK